MARLSRAEIFDPSEIVAAHTMARTNRRCFLMGDYLSPISIDEKNDPLSSQPNRNGKRCSDKGFLDGRMSHASPMSHASKSFPRRRESSGVPYDDWVPACAGMTNKWEAHS